MGMGDFFQRVRRLSPILFLIVVGLPWAGYCGAEDFMPRHIPLSPQLTHPHNGWVPFMPFVLMALVALLFWWDFRHHTR
jgi:hypothetical protein